MFAANMAARQTFKFFWRELSWEQRRIVPGLGLSVVKMPFVNVNQQEGEPEAEHMWISEIRFDGVSILGTLMSEPQWVDTVEVGDDVSVPLEEIDDWMYTINDVAFGGYTINYLRSKMSKQERTQHDNAWGIYFGDPNIIEIVPIKEFGISTESGQAPTFAELERIEHPMSDDSREQYREAFTNDPSLITWTDDEGWTLLHRESLAGNLTPVQLLLEHGADRHFKTPTGYTAIDLAEKMGWPAIVELLKS